ncbi:unnamed protein product [Ceratitis capitata]|uniref:(Mediterranean fruit fly) hypothetical protein n=1 Tax=Ceratitis capitata TaxID=7213 RepID=A0A811VKZ9_CERCA|nr:unnamed protein product [Ceratitis capitata]
MIPSHSFTAQLILFVINVNLTAMQAYVSPSTLTPAVLVHLLAPAHHLTSLPLRPSRPSKPGRPSLPGIPSAPARPGTPSRPGFSGTPSRPSRPPRRVCQYHPLGRVDPQDHFAPSTPRGPGKPTSPRFPLGPGYQQTGWSSRTFGALWPGGPCGAAGQ